MSDRHESFLAGMLDRIQSYRWPKKGDRLLMQSQDCENAAEISSDVISRHVHIWDGNMRAGAVLIGACGENNPDRHSLIYPNWVSTSLLYPLHLVSEAAMTAD